MKNIGTKNAATAAFHFAASLLIYLGQAGWVMDTRAWVYFTSFAPQILACAIYYPKLAPRRFEQGEIPRGEQTLLRIYFFVFVFFLYAAAGYYSRSAPAAGVTMCLGAGCNLLAAALLAFTLRALRAPEDARVYASFPYRVIRFPAALARTLWCLGAAFAFGTLPVALIASILIGVIIRHTVLLDRRVISENKAYADYARTVRFRMIPGIW